MTARGTQTAPYHGTGTAPHPQPGICPTCGCSCGGCFAPMMPMGGLIVMEPERVSMIDVKAFKEARPQPRHPRFQDQPRSPKPRFRKGR